MECIVTEPYRDFTALALYAEKDLDYRIRIVDRSAAVTVVAIQAGAIEPLTGELAEAIAGSDCNLYQLQGLRPDGADRLRVPVTRYDDVRLTSLLDRSVVGISVQGTPDEEHVVHLGGRNRRLCAHLQVALERAGFCTSGPAGPQAAHSPARFVNRPAQGGVQMEISIGLRRAMAETPLEGLYTTDSAIAWTGGYSRFVMAVRQGLAAYLAALDADLDVAMERFEQATREVRWVLPTDGDGHDRDCQRSS